ncbi:MAG: sulfatase-like hydrolase/transferase [Phycisphaerae bacterium]
MTQEVDSQTGAVNRGIGRWVWRLGLAVLALGGAWVWFYPSGTRDSGAKPAGARSGSTARLTRIDPLPIRLSPQSRRVEAIPASSGSLAGSNLLLITLDTTRADRVGCYGHDGIATPAIDGLAEQGVLFTRAVAPAPTTAASHASILTGIHPHHHGVMTNGLYRLNEGVPMLAEVLRARGYATAATVSTVVLHARFGLNRGFQVYDDEVDLSAAAGPDDRPERRGDHTTDRAIAWLDTVQAAQPFFLWLHLYDPHAPYEPPSPFAQKYRSPAYDGEIAFADSQVARVLEAIRAKGATQNTLVVLAGDHGEGLGQHGEPFHGYLLYESTLHVPLIFSAAGLGDHGVHVDERVSLVDILPTALSLLGMEPIPELDGRDLTDPGAIARPIRSSTFHGLMAHGWAPLFAIYDGPNKYIHGPAPELYDLDGDPFETHNLLAADGTLGDSFRQRLVEFFGPDLDVAQPAEPTEQLSAEDRRQLESLGYVLGGATSSRAGPRPDPKRMLVLKYQVEAITSSPLSGQRLDQAIQSLRRITQDHPDFEPAFVSLAELCRDKGAYAWAESALKQADQISPDMPHTLLLRAELRELQDDLGGAAAVYRRLLSLYPDHYDALIGLGKLLQRTGQAAQAIEPFGRAFAVAPSDAAARDGLVGALTAAGRDDQAIDILSQALVRNPELIATRSALARMLFSHKRYRQAVGTLRDGLRIQPHQPQLATNLALILMSAEDPQVWNASEAVSLLEGVCRQTGDPQADCLLRLSLAHQAAGDLDQAVAAAEKALQSARSAKQSAFVTQIEQQLQTLGQLRDQAALTNTPPTGPGNP